MSKANGLDQFYSRREMTAGGKEKIEYFVTLSGKPTIDYPHVHVIFLDGEMTVVASFTATEKIWRTTVKNASGPQMNKAIKTAREKLAHRANTVDAAGERKMKQIVSDAFDKAVSTAEAAVTVCRLGSEDKRFSNVSSAMAYICSNDCSLEFDDGLDEDLNIAVRMRIHKETGKKFLPCPKGCCYSAT